MIDVKNDSETEKESRPAENSKKTTGSKRKPTAIVSLKGLNRDTAEQLIHSETGEHSKPTNADETQFSMQQPAWHVVALMIATGKLYFIWWCYKNWRDLYAKFKPEAPVVVEEKLISRISPKALSDFSQVSPMLRGLGLLIPYWNNYLFLTLAYGIAKLHPDKQSSVATMPFAAALIVTLVFVTTSMLSILPEISGGSGAWYFLFLTGAVPVAFVQHWLNKYWKSQEPDGLVIRHGFSGAEIGMLVAGSLFFGCIIASFIMGANK